MSEGSSLFITDFLISCKISGTKYSNRTVTSVAIWWQHIHITGAVTFKLCREDPGRRTSILLRGGMGGGAASWNVGK